jgi:hypothetical protein
VIAALPCPEGWQMQYDPDEDPDSPERVQVVAWAITETGEGFPMYFDPEGGVLETFGHGAKVTEPGQSPGE